METELQNEVWCWINTENTFGFYFSVFIYTFQGLLVIFNIYFISHAIIYMKQNHLNDKVFLNRFHDDHFNIYYSFDRIYICFTK